MHLIYLIQFPKLSKMQILIWFNANPDQDAALMLISVRPMFAGNMP